MHVVSKSLALCMGLLTTLCALAQTEPQPQDIDVVRTSTNLVTVPISVMDRQGRFIPDLYDDVIKDSERDWAAGQIAAVDLKTAKGERLSVAYERAGGYLRALPDKSGGRFFHAESPGHLTGIFSRIAQELREQYSLGYYPKNHDPSVVERSIKMDIKKGEPGGSPFSL